MDAYASVGMPVIYRHWSFGKQFISTEKNYRRGHMGLAYEIVINSDPCIAYLMEENTMAMQALVIAHAGYGHNSLLQGQLPVPHVDGRQRPSSTTWSSPGTTSAECEERHGVDAVEELLDSCHALMNYGVDRYRRPQKLSLSGGRGAPRGARALSAAAGQRPVAHPAAQERRATPTTRRRPSAFRPSRRRTCSTSSRRMRRCWSPGSARWCASCARSAQYFYPQRQTQVMNEGWATFWHYTLLNTLYDEGLLADGFMIELLQLAHQRGVPAAGRPPCVQRHQSLRAGFCDVHRHAAHLREPDRGGQRWFPDIAGSPTGRPRWTSPCAISRTKASSASTCRPS